MDLVRRNLRLLISTFILMLLVSYAGAVPTIEAREKTNVTGKPESERKIKAMAPKLVDRYAIGCVLPLTGRYAAAGNRALEAIILATGVFDPLVKSPIKLIIEDSKSRPEIARAAVNKLAVQDGVLCIIGPLSNAEAPDAAQEAQRFKIPIITLVQKEKITDIGDYVFRIYMTNTMQIRALVKYAIEYMDLKKCAVLYPADNYGREMESLFRVEVKNQGAEIQKSQSYKKTQTDFGQEIKVIADIKISSPERSENSNLENVYKPIIDFDSLFIPDSAARINMILPQLAFYNVRGVKLLGTSSWNSPDLLKTGAEYLEGAVFTDGFSLNSFYPEANDFIDIFYTSYSREPDAMEALVYDATRLIVDTIKEYDIETRDQLRDRILRIRNYRGVTGRTSFSGMRDAQKDLFLLMVKDGRIIQVK
jgi:ABC-type branched-subunit amino acid transport system substrate-binding protein